MTWPLTKLDEFLKQRDTDVSVEPAETYRFAGMYSFGRGMFRSQVKGGSDFSYRLLTRLQAGDFVYLKLMAWEGGFGVVPPECAGCVVSPEFPVFEVERAKAEPRYLEFYFRAPGRWEALGSASIGTNVRRRRLSPTDLLSHSIPLPPLAEQQRIVARIEELAGKVDLARRLRVTSGKLAAGTLESAFRRISSSAPKRPLGEIAPLRRRPVAADFEGHYPQVSARSFGKGTFHRPPILGREMSWQKLFLVREGDILISNIKAWEGAVAVAMPADEGRFASHRYLTCVPKSGVAEAQFVAFYLLTVEGIHALGEASPGSADRNRTLSSRALLEIKVPVPPIDQQRWFSGLVAKTSVLRSLQAQTSFDLDALLPSILNRAFRGEL